MALLIAVESVNTRNSVAIVAGDGEPTCYVP
jgi:hypothetical protein